MDLRLAPGRWMGSAAASGSDTGEDCGEDLLSNCGWEGGGVSLQLFNMKGDHFSTCFLFPIMHYCARIFLYSDSTADEKEEH